MMSNPISSQRCCRCFYSSFNPSSFWRLTAMIVALCALFQFQSVSAAPSCGSDEFRVLVGRIGEPGSGVGCRPCSVCPVNQIIRRPCSRVTDTVCGPLYDFEFMNIQQQTVAPAAAAVLSRRTWQLPAVTVRSRDVSADAAGDGTEYSHQSSRGDSSLLSTCSGDVWRIFCYGVISSVIVLLCVLCIMYFVMRTGRLQSCCGQKQLTNTEESYRAVPEVVLVGVNDDSMMVETAVVVDPHVRHLETQLYNNRIQQLVADRLFGSSRPHTGLYNGNEYLDERYRVRMMRPAVRPATDSDFSADQQRQELAPLAVVGQQV